MSQMTTNTEMTTESIANKKPYHTPKLNELGNVKELTLTNPGSPGDPSDGGSFPNNYVS